MPESNLSRFRELIKSTDPNDIMTGLDDFIGYVPFREYNNDDLQKIELQLHNSNPMVRDAAITALWVTADNYSVPALLNLVNVEQDPEVRNEAFEALDYFTDPRIRSFLLEEAYKSEEERRPHQVTARALGRYNDPESRNVLIYLFQNHKDAHVRDIALESLYKINHEDLRCFWVSLLPYYDEVDVVINALKELDNSHFV